MSATATAIKIAAQLAADKKSRKKIIKVIGGLLIFVILLFLLILIMIAAVFEELSPSGDDLKNNKYYQAKEAMKTQYNISNDLDITYLQYIDLTVFDILKDDVEEIKSDISANYIKSETLEIEVDGKIVEQNITLFKDIDEITVLMKSAPYNLTDDDIEFVKAIATSSFETPLLGNYPMPMNGSITSTYGNRVNPVTGQGMEFHRGIDILGKWHDKIVSIADGEVYKVNNSTSSWGNYVIIKHETEDGIFYSLSAHMSAIIVNKGDKVSQGQVIGFEGGDQQKDPNPGNTTGHHLHFEIWTSSNSKSHTDPAKYILK